MRLSLDELTPIEVQDRLREAFDFDVGLGQGEPSWCSIEGVNHPEVIARDGSGGEFIALRPSARVLWVSSEGEASVIAADLEELVSFVGHVSLLAGLVALLYHRRNAASGSKARTVVVRRRRRIRGSP